MMRWKRSSTRTLSGIDLLEEAFFVLRNIQPVLLLSYLLGTVPFILGLLYFWTDMSRSPFAAAHVGQSALGMSFLYIWMKAWHSVFASRLLSSLTGEYPEPFSVLRTFRMIAAQLAVQPFSWILVPIFGITTIGLPWVQAFFHSYSITADGNHTDLRSAMKRAWNLSNLWQAQNHVMVFLLLLFTFSIFSGITIFIISIPFLLNSLFGIETIFTYAGPAALFNSTFIAITASLTYLFVNPLIKIAYVLRAFYGQSLRSGADLLAELRVIEVTEEKSERSTAKSLVLSSILILMLFGSANGSEVQNKIAPDQLDKSIEQIIHQREYQWRLPREPQDLKNDKSFMLDFIKGVQDTLGRWLEPLGKFFKKVIQWIYDKLFPTSQNSNAQKAPISDQSVWLIVLIGAAVLLLGFLLYRMWKGRHQDEVITAQEATVAIPDLKDESTTADQFPEEGWLSLAREYLERGELRLALRALYLSSLALLSRRGILTITKYKSNREYNRELQRKAQTNHDLLDAFQENLFLFERSWYGEHEVNNEILSKFNLNQAKIREIA
jgi:flagellar basal body-associated protein FliL